MKQCILLVLTLITTQIFAQKSIMKWGVIPNSELTMKTYPLDEEADAVVLGQKVYVKYDFRGDDDVMIYNYHVRIKILTEAGVDKANIEIPYHHGNKLEKIGSIKGQVINNVNGKAIKSKLTKDGIFIEKEDENWSYKRLTFPAVEVGSIIEYRYELTSQILSSLQDFYFQREIPVKWTQVEVRVPQFFEYVFIHQATKAYHINTQESMSYPIAGINGSYTGTRYVWAAKNMPAIRGEAFISTLKDYRQCIKSQLQTVKFPGRLHETYFSTWYNSKKQLMGSSSFGQRLKSGGIRKLKGKCSAITDASLSDIEKTHAIYTFVQQNMSWDETFGMFVGNSFDNIFAKQKGSAADINMMLTALLLEAGIEANPVLISTRKHGRPMMNYPIIDQFNYVIVEAIIDDKALLLDAVNPILPMGTVSVRCLNQVGWSLRGTGGTWINITPNQYKETKQIRIQLEEDGSVSGSIQSIYDGYASVMHRGKYLSMTEDDYIDKRLQADISDFTIDSVTFKNEQSIGKRFYETIYFHVPEMADVSGDMIYLDPLFGEGWEENPFKMENRTYPIDLAYPMSEQIIITVTPPKGYVIDEAPKPTMVKLLEKGGSFRFMGSQLPTGQVQYVSKLQLKSPIYESTEYEYIKQFFDMIVEKHETQIVLKKAE